ncbi:MAG: PAS domain S-box protein [Usitatibacteraceae bacterium]
MNASENPSRRSIAQKLFWIAVGSIVVSGFCVALALNYLRTQTLAAGAKATASLAHVVEEQTARTIQTIDQRLQLSALSLQTGPAGELTDAAARTLLRHQLEELPFVRAIWTLNVQGRIKYNSDEGNLGLNLADRDYFQIYQSRPKHALYIGKPVRSRTTGTWLISVARPLRSPDGNFAGVIVAALEPSYFESLWQKAELGAGGSIALWRRDGLLMMRSPADDSAMGKDFSSRDLFREALPKSPNGTFRVNGMVDGKLRNYTYRTVAAKTDLVVVVGQSFDVILDPWRQLAMVATAIWVLASILIVVLCVLLNRAWRQRLLAETGAKELAQRLTLATDAAAIGIWDWDVKAEKWFATPTCFTMLGEERGSGVRIGENWLAHVHPQDRARVQQMVQPVLDGTAEAYEYEARVQHADGSYRWVAVVGRLLAKLEDGTASRILGVRMDITERKLAEVTLRTAGAENRALISAIPDLIFTNTREGKFLAVHASDPTALLAPPEVFLGRNVDEVLSPQIAQRLQYAFAEALRTGTPQVLDYSLTVARGERSFEARVVPRDENTLITIVRDVTERKLTEEALQDSERRYRVIVEWSPNPICIYRDARIIYVNSALLRLAGASANDQLLGKSILELIHPDYHRLAIERLRSLASGGLTAPTAEMKFVKLDGSVFDAEVQSASLNYDGAPAVHVVIHDISERKRASRALRESEERLRSVWESSVDGKRLCDPEGRIVSVNRAYCLMLDADDQSLAGVSLADVYAPAEGQRILDRYRKNVAAKTVDENFERELQLKSGEKRWFAVSNTQLESADGTALVLSIFRDISGRKAAELAIAENEKRFRAIVEWSPEATCVYRDGKIVYVNPASVKLAGAKSAEDMIGTSILDFIHADSKARVLARMSAVAAGDTQNTLNELKFVKRDGSVIDARRLPTRACPQSTSRCAISRRPCRRKRHSVRAKPLWPKRSASRTSAAGIGIRKRASWNGRTSCTEFSNGTSRCPRPAMRTICGCIRMKAQQSSMRVCRRRY